VTWQQAVFIRRNAQIGKPFFTCVCFTLMHPALIHHPDFKRSRVHDGVAIGKGPARRDQALRISGGKEARRL
jgi:hypothetical protein